MQRERGGILVGAGAGLTLIVLLVLQSLIGSGLLSTRTVTETTTAAASTVPDAYDQVAGANAIHLLLLDSRNASALLSEYESNATIEWTGVVPAMAGNYSGSNEIGTLLDDFPGVMANLTLSNESQTMSGVRAGYWIVNSTFGWSGYSSRDGFVNGVIDATDSYAQVGNTWLIARETWNSLDFNCQFPGCRFP